MPRSRQVADAQVPTRRGASNPRPLPGTTGEVRRVALEVVQPLFLNGLVIAAGLDPVQLDEVPSVLWDSGTDRLLVHLAATKVTLGDGFVDVALVVECDQTRQTSVVVTLVTASSKRPAGFLVASEDRPRGPAVIVDNWGEALVALAWRALVEVARVTAGAVGRDRFDRPFVPSTVVATVDGLLVTPMVPFRFSDGPEARQ